MVSDLKLITADDFRTMGFKLGHLRRLTAKLDNYSTEPSPLEEETAESPILSYSPILSSSKGIWTIIDRMNNN